MFVRRLVTGVRSSCEASATSWRCACTEASSALIERSERVEHGVEAAAPAARSRPPDGLDPPAEVLRRADVLGGLGQALERLHGRAGHQAAEQGRQRDAADDEQREDQAQARQQAVDFGQRLGELHGASAAERLGEDAQVDAVHAGVAEERLAAVRGERAGARIDRQRHAGAPSAR